MPAVLVTGGTGTFGRHAVRALAARGHSVRVLSRQTAPELPEGAAAVQGNLATGAGIDGAVGGVDWILHAASNARTNAGAEDVDATRHLVAAARDQGPRLLYVSIVGIDRIPYRYYCNKLECERVVEASGLPFTIFRSTQFHEFAEELLRRLETFPVAPAPLSVKAQLVAAAEAAAAAVAALEDDRPRERVEFGGPQVLTGREIVRTWRERRGRPRLVVPLPLAGRVWHGFRAGFNTTPEHAEGRQTWAEFVAALT